VGQLENLAPPAYSYTQLAQYLACPLRYRYRYLDGWQEKETRAGLLFGRAFEQALAALFRREDPGCALFEAWSEYKNSPLEYPKSETWDQMLEQGIHLLTRFVQDDRVRIRNPRRNLQIKFSRPIGNGNEFVAYIDALGHLDGERSVIDWKTTGARYPDQPAGYWLWTPNSSVIPGSPENPTWDSWSLCASGWSRSSICAQPSPSNSVTASARWSRAPFDKSKPPSSLPEAASAFPRTAA